MDTDIIIATVVVLIFVVCVGVAIYHLNKGECE